MPLKGTKTGTLPGGCGARTVGDRYVLRRDGREVVRKADMEQKLREVERAHPTISKARFLLPVPSDKRRVLEDVLEPTSPKFIARADITAGPPRYPSLSHRVTALEARVVALEKECLVHRERIGDGSEDSDGSD